MDNEFYITLSEMIMFLVVLGILFTVMGIIRFVWEFAQWLKNQLSQ